VVKRKRRTDMPPELPSALCGWQEAGVFGLNAPTNPR
jgi:hypothetical protein